MAVLVRAEPELGMLTPPRCEVWGDPIAHSKSPALHRAAYAALGLEWSYDRLRVDESAFPGALGEAATRVRGLSLTMPLKGVAFAAAGRRDDDATTTGAVNTLVRTESGWDGFNTDVAGLVAVLRELGVSELTHARILGGGATATSALVALHRLGADRVSVVTRRHGAAAALIELAATLGVEVTPATFDDADATPVPVTVATIPTDAELPPGVATQLAGAGGILYDVAYGTWPTPLSRAWQADGLIAANGLGMLLHQAVRQVSAFLHGDPAVPLPDEASVVAAMRAAVTEADAVVPGVGD